MVEVEGVVVSGCFGVLEDRGEELCSKSETMIMKWGMIHGHFREAKSYKGTIAKIFHGNLFTDDDQFHEKSFP